MEDAALVSGTGRFLDDLDPLPGTLVAAVVRSTQPHARLVSVDLSRARAHPGVAAVIGPEEVRAALRPFPLSTGAAMPYLPSGVDTVRFVGEPIAVVVASDRYTAEDAAELVAVDYETLDVVTSTRQALEPDAPLLHPDNGSNVATDRTFSYGPVEDAFAAAAHVVEGEYDFPRYSSVPMECYSVIAHWTPVGPDADGPGVEAWANFHGPFTMVPVMAGALGLPTSSVRLHVPADIGGSFGIKAGIYPYVVLMALASKHSGTPVRWTEDRVEHLLASSTGADRVMRCAAAVDDDGTVTALRMDLVDNVGAYLRPPEPSTLYRCFGNITGPYRIGAVEIRARAVVTNQMPTGLNRGFGGQQLYFGLERLMDAVAAATGRDVLEVRRRNLVDGFPYETPTGGVYDSGDYAAAVDLAAKNADLDELRARQESARAEGAYYGVGVALVTDPSGTNIGYVGLATPAEERKPGRDKSGSTEHVRMSVDLQGRVTVMLGSVPQGQGHATVARTGRRGPARAAGRAGAGRDRHGHRDDAVDGHVRQLLVAVRSAGDQRRRRGGGPDRRDGARGGVGDARRRRRLPRARRRRRADPVRGVRPVPARRRRRALGSGGAAGGHVRAALRGGRVHARARSARPRATTGSTRRSATGSSPRSSPCGSTRTRSRSRSTASRPCTTRAPC